MRRKVSGQSWRLCAAAAGLAILGLARGPAWAQQPAQAPPDATDLRSRIERLEKQNDELLRTLQDLKQSGQRPDAAPGPSSVAEAAKESPGQPTPPSAKKDGEDVWFEVGKDLGLKARWVGSQAWLETDDKSIRIHVGGRTQVDGVWDNTTDRVQFGRGGIGKFADAVNFRRARLELEGWYYEVVDFKCEYDFVQTINIDPTTPSTETNVSNIPSPTDLWASLNYLPWVGTLRVGNQKNPIGLDHLISSRFLDFMERAAYFDTYFNRNNGFEPGIQILNWTENERATWQLGVFKNNQTIQGWNFGNGEYSLNARATWLPWYQDEARYMVHLGVAVQYDAPDDQTATLRDRWLLRNGPPTLQNTVAFASIRGHNQTIVMPEFFMNLGPLSIQAEYLANYMDQINSFATQPQGTVIVPGGSKTLFSQSAYVQALYFLTGEHRPYARTALHSPGAAPSRIVPFRNFFYLPGQCCDKLFSSGAWQLGVRYCYTDLSNNGIYGGQVNEVTLGLNWFLNPNMKVQWNYDVGYRGQLGPGSNSNGTFQGFGTRLAFDF